jgi:hypothetical protein
MARPAYGVRTGPRQMTREPKRGTRTVVADVPSGTARGPSSTPCQKPLGGRNVSHKGRGDLTCTTGGCVCTGQYCCTVAVLHPCGPAHGAVGPPRVAPVWLLLYGTAWRTTHEHECTIPLPPLESDPHPTMSRPCCACRHGWAHRAAARGGKIHQVSNASWIAQMGTLLFRATQVPNPQWLSLFFSIVGSLHASVPGLVTVLACAFWILLLCVVFCENKI